MKNEKYYEIKDMLENKDYLVKDLVNEINSLMVALKTLFYMTWIILMK